MGLCGDLKVCLLFSQWKDAQSTCVYVSPQVWGIMHQFGMRSVSKYDYVSSSEENNKSSKLWGLLQSCLKQKKKKKWFWILFVSAK